MYRDCKILKILSNDFVRVRCDGYNSAEKLHQRFLRRYNVANFKVGDTVECPYKDNGYFRGTITQANNDGTFNILFDDGDREWNVPASDLDLLEG